MKNIFSIFRSLGFALILFNAISVSGEIKPVAREIINKHNLKIGFPEIALFQNVNETLDGPLQSALKSGTTTTLIPGKLMSLVMQKPEAFTISVPFNGKKLLVELVRTNIFTEDFSVITGEGSIVPYTPGIYYRGIIKDNPASLASFSFFENELFGVISNEEGNINVGRQMRDGNVTDYVIFLDRNLTRPFESFCNAAVDENVMQALPPQANVATTKCARLYYEVDHDIYVNKSSSIVNTTNWMTAVHNNVQTLYANDNITVAISQVYVWSGNDPYTGGNSTQQLALFRSTRVSFNGDVAQLVAHDNNNGGLAATINGLCASSKYSYADVDYTYSNVLTYSWTVEVVTHEFGHVLGSRHTHNCSWPGGAIDNCGPNAGYPTEGGCANGPTPSGGGTIMSYCHLTGVGINFSNGFGPLPAGAIQDAVNGAPCLGSSCAVCPVPAHNDCSSPATLSVTSNCVYTSSNLCAATQSIAPINCHSRTAAHAYDVWYSVVPSQTSMVINCQSGTSTDIVLGLYSGGCGGLNLITCADATTAGGMETINASSLTAGNTYYIRVYDFNGATTGTDFGICASQNCVAAPNNSCLSPTAFNIGSTCNYVSGELCSATQSMNPSTCSNYTAATALDVWYTIVPTQNNVRIIAQSGANTDVVLGIYTGACGSLNLVRCIDSTGNGGIEILNAGVTIGTTYRIRVYDWGGNQFGTDFQICVQYLCVAPNAPTGATADNSTICQGAGTALNVTGSLSAGATWKWYSGSCGGTAAGTGSSINVTPSSTTTYYVRAENSSCYSTCSPVQVAVTQVSPPSSAEASSSPICIGSSSTVSANGSLSPGASWHWYSTSCGGTPEGTGSTLNVSPSVATTYFVRAENGGCFSSCESIQVGLTPVPISPDSANASPQTICGGNSLLSVSGILSPGASWEWYSGSCGGNHVGSGTTESVSPSSTRTYYVRAEDGDCNSACVAVVVNVGNDPDDPTAATPSFALICPGDFSTLTVAGTLSSGATWTWYAGSCGGSPAGTGTSLPVSPSVTTSYYVRAENGNCHSSCENTTINVLPSPGTPQSVIASPPIMCSGGSVTLNENASLPSGSDWYWYTGICGGTLIGQGVSISVSPVTAQTYYVRAENSGCRSTCVNTTISVQPSPANPVIVIGNDSLFVQTYDGYEWFVSPDKIVFNFTGNDQILPLTSEGYYFVVVTDANGCTSSSDTIYYDAITVTKITGGGSINIYPNPFNENLNIEMNFVETAEFRIYDSLGEIVFSDRLTRGDKRKVSMHEYAAGVYLVVLIVNDEVYSRKILKQ